MILLLLACAATHAPTLTLQVGSTPLRVEVADDPAERARGLMYRDALGRDEGMVFVYPDEQERSFWMKDTRIPLSIAFLDAGGRIVHLADMKPFDLDGTPSGAPAMYAIEVNHGWFAAHGVTTGDRVTGLPGPAAR